MSDEKKDKKDHPTHPDHPKPSDPTTTDDPVPPPDNDPGATPGPGK